VNGIVLSNNSTITKDVANANWLYRLDFLTKYAGKIKNVAWQKLRTNHGRLPTYIPVQC
jgi:hypothetical protein